MVPTQSFKDTKDLEKSFDEFFSKFLKFPQALSIPLFTWTIDVQQFHVVVTYAIYLVRVVTRTVALESSEDSILGGAFNESITLNARQQDIFLLQILYSR